MVRDLDIGLLRAFATVVEARSVSGAADRLARTQAAVSMQLRQAWKRMSASGCSTGRRAASA